MAAPDYRYRRDIFSTAIVHAPAGDVRVRPLKVQAAISGLPAATSAPPAVDESNPLIHRHFPHFHAGLNQNWHGFCAYPLVYKGGFKFEVQF